MMTMRQLQNRLARIMRDIEAVKDTLSERGLLDDYHRMHKGETPIGLVCLGYLDEKVLEDMDEIQNFSVDRLHVGELPTEEQAAFHAEFSAAHYPTAAAQ